MDEALWTDHFSSRGASTPAIEPITSENAPRGLTLFATAFAVLRRRARSSPPGGGAPNRHNYATIRVI